MQQVKKCNSVTMNFLTAFAFCGVISAAICRFPEDNLNATLPPDEVLIDGDVLIKRSAWRNNSRITLLDDMLLWPAKTVPYVISSAFGETYRNNIISAMNTIAELSGCIRFIPRTIENDFVNIVYEGGCASFVGRIQGAQNLNLGGNCAETLQTIIHELMHTLGVFHEHQRYDRDDYLYVYWDNVMQGVQNMFDKYPQKNTHRYYRPFDFQSTMMYVPDAYAKAPGLLTLSSKISGVQMVTHATRSAISRGDVITLRGLYHCNVI